MTTINTMTIDQAACRTHSTALGMFCSRWTSHGLYALSWTDAPQPIEPNPLPSRWREAASKLDRALQAYGATEPYDWQRVFAEVTIDPSGWTAFQEAVYRQCQMIPAGTTVSYKTLAERCGRAGASRAVGSAMAANRVLIVIPCHRVIASSGKLAGYSGPGGMPTKQKLLDRERMLVPSQR